MNDSQITSLITPLIPGLSWIRSWPLLLSFVYLNYISSFPAFQQTFLFRDAVAVQEWSETESLCLNMSSLFQSYFMITGKGFFMTIQN